MKGSIRTIGIYILTAILGGCGGHSIVIPAQTQVAAREVANPKFLALPSRDVDFASLDAQRAASVTIPFFHGHVESPLDHVVHSYRIAGSDPTKSDTTTNVVYKPIVLRVHFPDGVVLDPTKPGCDEVDRNGRQAKNAINRASKTRFAAYCGTAIVLTLKLPRGFKQRHRALTRTPASVDNVRISTTSVSDLQTPSLSPCICPIHSPLLCFAC